METISVLLAICDRWFPAQRPVTRGFNVLFDLRLNKWLSKTGDLRCYRAHYDVTVMFKRDPSLICRFDERGTSKPKNIR